MTLKIPEHIDVGGGLYRCTYCDEYVWEDRHLHEISDSEEEGESEQDETE